MGKIGSGSGTSYPASIDTATTEVDSPAAGKTRVRAEVFNDEAAAIVAIQNELGTDPAGTLTDVKTNLQTQHTAAGAHLKIWKRVYSSTLSSASQSETISSLDGNTDVMYMVIIRVVVGNTISLFLRPNNDSGSNYGFQEVNGSSTTASASRNTSQTGLWIGDGVANDVVFFKGLLYAKSGYERTLNGESMTGVTGTTVGTTLKVDSVWSNTSSNITSLVVYASAASGLGIGTFIELWKRLPSS